jgi:hypothetical protein
VDDSSLGLSDLFPCGDDAAEHPTAASTLPFAFATRPLTILVVALVAATYGLTSDLDGFCIFGRKPSEAAGPMTILEIPAFPGAKKYIPLFQLAAGA